MRANKLPLVVAVVAVLLWQGIVVAFKVPNYLVPAPLEIARLFPERIADLGSAFLITGAEALGGFLLSIGVGLLTGMFFSLSPLVRRSFYPYIVLLQTIPIIAISPLILLWLGNGSLSILFISFLISLPAVAANATQGLISVDLNHLNLFRMGNASTLMTLFKLRLPNALPSLFVGMKIAAGASVVGALVGETFAGSSAIGHGGLGYSSVYALNQLDTPYLFALVITSSVMGLAFYYAVTAVERLSLRHWHDSLTAEQPE